MESKLPIAEFKFWVLDLSSPEMLVDDSPDS
jgi:hypothetical protein